MGDSLEATPSRLELLSLSLCLLAIAVTLPARETTPQGVVACHPKAKPVCDALDIEDPKERQDASWRTIREAFVSSDSETRSVALKELSLRSWRMDLTAFLPLIDEFGPSIDIKEAAQLIDRVEITYGVRANRIELLGQAIRSGKVKQRRGTETPRSVAAYWAAYQGLSELRPMAMEYLSTLPAQRRRRLNLESVPALFDLCDGSRHGRDCPRVAATRLLDMNPEQLHDRLMSDWGFRAAVVRLRDSACDSAPPFSDPACSAFQTISLPPEAPQEPEENTLAAPPRIRWIDPCTVPELAEHWSDVWIPAWPGLLDLSRPRSDGSATFVSLADGATEHRPGELVRFRIDVRDSAGKQPSEPVVVRIEVVGSKSGWVSPPGEGLRCQSVQFLWNHPESGGGVIPTYQEFDYKVGGVAEIAGLIPIEGSRFNPVWRSRDGLKISVGELRDFGEVIEHVSDGTWEIRPEGDRVSSWKPIVDRLRAVLRSSDTKAIFLDLEITRPSPNVTLKPTRRLVVMACESNRPRRVLISSVRKDTTRLSDNVPVMLYSVDDSGVCVGSFTLVPQGALVEGLAGPLIEVPSGNGHIEARLEAGEEQ